MRAISLRTSRSRPWLSSWPVAAWKQPARLEGLAEKARDYAKAATAANTQRAYAADWRHYSAWARRQNLPALPPDPQAIGLYIAA